MTNCAPNDRPANVLLSESDDALRRALARVLTYEGFTVTPVPDLLRGLMYVNREIETEHHEAIPDVVITGIPSDGEYAETLALARKVGRRIPVVLLTDRPEATLRETQRDALIEVLE